MKIKPDYTNLEFADQMGEKLRSQVEEQLKEDLKIYGVSDHHIQFDWSESCIEGHHTKYLGGSVENFSGISVFDKENNLIAEGWMEFIHEPNFFLAYWNYVSIWNGDKKITEKEFGLPEHIWNQIPEEIRNKYYIDQP